MKAKYKEKEAYKKYKVMKTAEARENYRKIRNETKTLVTHLKK